MKERSILFTGAMVRAILEGRKTQTRRVKNHYGDPGDRLWVKETYAPMLGGGHVYAADYTPGRLRKKDGHGFWNPSLFMRRSVSRITLEIVAVRSEQVQEISEEDALAEGAMEWWASLSPAEQMSTYNGGHGPVAAFQMLWDSINAKRGFGWDANPWVWVIQFRKL